MATAKNILKNFNLFVDGRGYAGNVEELQLPNMALKVDDFRAGGMDSSVALDMGQEKMEFSATLTGFDLDVLKLWGVSTSNIKQFIARGALEDIDGTVTPVAAYIGGTIRSLELGAFKAGDKSTLKLTVDVRTYRYEQDGQEIYNIDIENMVRTINGVDQLKAKRAALGI